MLLIASDGAWGQPAFSPSQDPLAGSRVFGEKGCEKCHAINGVGGKIGPDLAKSSRPHSFFDVATAMWNHLPRMTDRMKQLGIARPQLDAREAGDLIGFLYTLNYFDPPGNAAAGRRLFADKKCVACHQAGGTGGTVGPKLDSLKQFASPMYLASGPDLVALGVRRSPTEFAATIWNKAPAMMKAMGSEGVKVPQLKPEEMADIVAYLYSVRYFARGGSIPRGWVVATNKGCLYCHGVHGERDKPASDLTRARGLDSTAAVIAALWNHAVVTPTVAGKKLPWPTFKPDEMADLVTLLQDIHHAH